MSSDNAVGFGRRISNVSATPARPLVETPTASSGTAILLALVFSRGSLIILLGSVLSAAAIIFAFSVLQPGIEKFSTLKARGLETTGSIETFYTGYVGRHAATFARYTYDAPSASGTQTLRFEGSAVVDNGEYASATASRTLPVIYDPQNPGTASANFNDWIHRWTPDGGRQFELFLSCGFLFVIWFPLGILALARRRR